MRDSPRCARLALGTCIRAAAVKRISPVCVRVEYYDIYDVVRLRRGAIFVPPRMDVHVHTPISPMAVHIWDTANITAAEISLTERLLKDLPEK